MMKLFLLVLLTALLAAILFEKSHRSLEGYFMTSVDGAGVSEMIFFGPRNRSLVWKRGRRRWKPGSYIWNRRNWKGPQLVTDGERGISFEQEYENGNVVWLSKHKSAAHAHAIKPFKKTSPKFENSTMTLYFKDASPTDILRIHFVNERRARVWRCLQIMPSLCEYSLQNLSTYHRLKVDGEYFRIFFSTRHSGRFHHVDDGGELRNGSFSFD